MDGDLIGTVRREDFESGHSIWVRLDADATPGNEWSCVWSTYWSNISCTRSPTAVADDPVIGAVPGTPAAADLLATPVPLTDDQHWQWRASMIADLSGLDYVTDDDSHHDRSYFEAIADGLLKAGWRFGGASPAAPAAQPAEANLWVKQIENPKELPGLLLRMADLLDALESLPASLRRCADVARIQAQWKPAAPADDEAAKRCPSCEHTMGFHQPEGCWYTVTDGKPGRNLVCVCEVSIGALAALREGQ